MSPKTVYIFGKQGCAKCLTTKNKVGHYINKWGMDGKVPVVFMDMDTPDGLSEGSFRDVLKVPTTIVEQGTDTLARWEGKIPNSENLQSALGV